MSLEPPPGMLGILVDGKVVPCDSLMTWGRWFEAASRSPGPRGGTLRHIGETEVNGVRVSTVFLGIRHGWGTRPQWFETMIFGGPLDGLQHRYETHDEAVAGHEFVVALARGEDRRGRDEVKALLFDIAARARKTQER